MFSQEITFIEDNVLLTVLRQRLATKYKISRQYSDNIDLSEASSVYIIGQIFAPTHEVIYEIQKKNKLSVIMVMEDENVHSMEFYKAGADFVFNESMNIWELFTRITTAMERMYCYSEVLRIRNKFNFFKGSRTISYENKFVKLNHLEYLLTKILVDNFEQTIDVRSELRKENFEVNCSYQLVSINLHTLRRKLSPLGLQIMTIKRGGYALCKIDKPKVETKMTVASF